MKYSNVTKALLKSYDNNLKKMDNVETSEFLEMVKENENTRYLLKVIRGVNEKANLCVR